MTNTDRTKEQEKDPVEIIKSSLRKAAMSLKNILTQEDKELRDELEFVETARNSDNGDNQNKDMRRYNKQNRNIKGNNQRGQNSSSDQNTSQNNGGNQSQGDNNSQSQNTSSDRKLRNNNSG